ncbi:Mobile element protein [Streptococcus gordonii]|uniref:Mobile element protein n=1 Tax=Streptococcus gordonii TaxID=1302 RepID=A0A139NG27_STRGN|nr:Mobile element protein [Streptococcus gordonii]
MEQFNFITNLLGIKDPNIIILDVLDAGTHKEIITLNIKKEGGGTELNF